MTPELITRVVNLIQKNGDKVVLADPTTGKAVVVMDLDAYEKLCVTPTQMAMPVAQPAPAPAYVPAPAPMPVQAAPVAAAAPAPFVAPAPLPTPAPAPFVQPVVHVSKMAAPEPKKVAEISEEMPKKKAVKVTPEMMGVTQVMADLTQEQLIDKINRDIGAWKTAQDRRRTDELKSAAQRMPQMETVGAIEEEERFYLEPIE